MARIVVGVDGTDRGEDAVVFARRLAEAAHAELVLVHAYPASDLLGRAPRARDTLREEALGRLAAVRDRLAPGAAITAIGDPSPARALQAVAARRHTALLVVGSTGHGRAGRVAPGTTGEHLLHGAPCPVAVVPRAYAVSSRIRIRRIGVGIDGGPESAAALAAAARIAEAFDAELEVIRAYTPGGLPPDAALARDLAVHAQRQLADALALLGPTVAAYPMLIDEPPARALAERSGDLDLLLVGSRGYGPTRSVLLGGVSGRLIRRAECPVVVVPRGVRTPLETLFSARVAAPAR